LGKVEGEALKNCSFSVDGIEKKGEAVLTKFGIEGGAIYGLSKTIRENLLVNKNAVLHIDFKPDTEITKIAQLLSQKGKHSVKDILSEKLKLSVAQISLLKSVTTKEEYNDPLALSELIKSFQINLTDFAPVDEAISTVGGINLHEVDKSFQLIKLPNHYCIGEMLDWDAPTGGYLLQACFSMGKFLADELNGKVYNENDKRERLF
jgi:predicted flavoprotein YhiN